MLLAGKELQLKMTDVIRAPSGGWEMNSATPYPEQDSINRVRSGYLVAFALVLLAAASAPAFGQAQVWVVDDSGGPGVDFTTIPDAIAAAADGDVLLVREGVYGGDWTTIDGKSLTISADTGAEVTLDKLYFRVQNLAANQTVTFHGLYSTQFSTTYVTAMEFLGNAGTIWIEDCDLYGGISAGIVPLIRAISCNRVVIQRSTLRGLNAGITPSEEPTAAMMTLNSSVYLHDCTLMGGLGVGPHGFYLTHGYPGATVRGGLLYASGGGFYGGSAGAGAGGHGVHLVDGDPAYYHTNVTHQGGAGTIPNLPGKPIQVDSGFEQELSTFPHSFEASSPNHAGSNVMLSFVGEPGASVLLLFNLAPTADLFLGYEGPLLVDLSSVWLWPMGTIPAIGPLNFTTRAPALPGLSAVQLYHQALFVSGGDATLGPGSYILYLDP
jgi:hypothetical protein